MMYEMERQSAESFKGHSVGAEQPILLDGVTYKATAVSDLVVARRVQLMQDKFLTYHDYEQEPTRKKTWFLSSACQLVPSKVTGISEQSHKGFVRPTGTWSVTAKFRGAGEKVELYKFNLHWPKSWAAKGYTTFIFGFTTLDEARRWHALLTECINALKDRSFAKHSKPQTTTSTASPITKQQQETGGPVTVFDLESKLPQEGIKVTAQASSVLTATTDDFLEEGRTKSGFDSLHPLASQADSDSDSDGDSLEARKARRRARMSMHERWVPYKQFNGTSVYYHACREDDEEYGGEYMVSVVVRGGPDDVLDVLMNGSVNTTILGPARKVQMLEQERITDTTTKELMRITIEAPGWAGFFCAPRDMVVERLFREDKTDENGHYVVMFQSSDELVLRSKNFMCPSSRDAGNVIEEHVAPAGQGTSRSLWPCPVEGNVNGVYTISCLSGHNLHNSPESLITCMVKVNLKGWCPHGWLGALPGLLGWKDAFLNRILMNVMLVRDEVEHSRFQTQPQRVMVGPVAGPVAVGNEEPTFGSTANSTTNFMKNLSMVQRGSGLTFNQAAGTNPKPPKDSAGSQTSANPFGSAVDLQTIIAEQLRQGGTLNYSPDQGNEGVLDLEKMAQLSTLEHKYWSTIHAEGTDAPYSVRGPTYLKDKKKIPAGMSQFAFAAMDVIQIPCVTEHVARFLPSIRDSGVPFAIIINLVIPGTPLLGIVATFATEQHPNTLLENPPQNPMEEEHSWQPFDFVLHKFLNGSTETRNQMLKLIPHIADGSWLIKSSVGTTPVILGKALKTTYHVTPQYIEIDIDISANNVAAYVTGLVRGATKSLVIDMGFVLEGTAPWELPEALLGTMRLNRLDISKAKLIDVTKEIPLRPPQPRYPSMAEDPNEGSERSTRTGSMSNLGAIPLPSMAPVSGNGQIPTTGSGNLPSVSSGTARPSSQGGLMSGSGNQSSNPTTFGMRHRSHTRNSSIADSLSVQNSVPAPHDGASKKI